MNCDITTCTKKQLTDILKRWISNVATFEKVRENNTEKNSMGEKSTGEKTSKGKKYAKKKLRGNSRKKKYGEKNMGEKIREKKYGGKSTEEKKYGEIRETSTGEKSRDFW